MAMGLPGAIGLLIAASLLFVLTMAALVTIFGWLPGGSDDNYVEVAWISLMRTLDPGTMGGDTGWRFRLAMLVVTVGGIFLVSTLIGIINNAIADRIGDLRKGRSLVVERGHTLILGWSPQVFSIVKELVEAKAHQSSPAIVVLAARDTVEMDDAIRARVPHRGRTRIVCRTGSPIDSSDLEIANLDDVGSIIVLAPDDVPDPDAHVIKTLLAILNNPNRRSQPFRIVADLRDASNVEVAKLVGKNEVKIVLAPDLVARVAVQTCRQSGLSAVYSDLLSFAGSELYCAPVSALTGLTFADALLRCDTCALVGIRFADGRSQLNPPMDTRFGSGDDAIAIAEERPYVSAAKAPFAFDEAAIRPRRERQPVPERTLILGWNRRAPTIVNELDAYVAPGSVVTLVAAASHAAAEIAFRCAGLKHQTAKVEVANTTDRRALEALRVESYDHVIVLGDSDHLNPQQADAHTLTTLLHLRDMAEKGGHVFSIVGEMLDVRDRTLAEATRADDFIVSDELVSLMLSQLSENWELSDVYDDLFDEAGSEIYLKPAGDYVELGRPVSFATIVASARARGEAAIGYRVRAESSRTDLSHGVRLNPRKPDLVTLGETDRIIVVAEN